MKAFVFALSAALTLGVVGTPIVYTSDAEAKGFRSSSSSFSRSSFRSTSSWGSSKSSKSTSKPSGGFWSSKPKTTSKPSGSLKTASAKQKSAAETARAKRTKQVREVQRQQSQFKKTAYKPAGLNTTTGKKPSRFETNRAYEKTYGNNAVFNRARTVDSSTYYDRRQRYYSGWDAPTYVYAGSPSYGMWDAMFMYMMLDNMNDASRFAHNHASDPGYQEWRREAEALAKDNAELQAKLAALDTQTATLAGTPVDPSFLPAGTDPDIALSQAARVSALPDMKVCTGGDTGAYFLITAGVLTPRIDKANIVPVVTQGTGQALDFIREGKCDAAWIQPDGYWNYIEDNETTDLPFTRAMSPYREGVHVMCHEDGPSKISQLRSRNSQLWFPSGSGAGVTFRNWLGEDASYNTIRTVLTDETMKVDSNEAAYMKAVNDPTKNSCMMYVAAPGATEFMRNIDKGSRAQKMVLIDIDDGDFDNTEDPSGADIYDFMEFDSSLYPNLTRQAGVIYGSGDINTLDMKTDFVVSTAWQKKYPKIYPKVALKLASLEDVIATLIRSRTK